MVGDRILGRSAIMFADEIWRDENASYGGEER
jgi:hypothetical protein